MNSNKKTPRIVGVLFISATVSAVLSGFLIGPILDGPDYLIAVSANENQVLIAVLLELILAVSVVGIAVFLFPIFREHNEALALGYVGLRILEGIIIIVGAISALLLLTLSQEHVAGASDASNFQTSATLLIAERDWTFLLGPVIVFSLNSLILNYLLYQSRLVPRFISVWGLIGATLLLAAGLLGMFDIYNIDSTVFLAAPIGVNEMVLAVWLIVKGFNPSAIVSESA